MPEFTSHQPGSFCWLELGTSDPGAARKFYTSVFGWDVNEIPMGEMGTYYIFQKNGKNVSAMYAYGPEEKGMPTFWMSYVAVTDADATAEKVKSLGGSIHKEPFDVFEEGRMAVCSDSQGAAFSIWQAKKGIGIEIRDEDNTLCWNELQARDVDAAKKFYPALFGWTMKESPEYTEWMNNGQSIGGLMKSQAPAEVPPHWMAYIAVDDCDGTVAKAKSAGGTVYLEPMDYPGVGRFAIFGDPQGAVLAVIKLSLSQHQ